MARKYPLEIILRHTGQAELVDGNDDVLWSSDSDPDFKDEVSQEFLTEEDVDDILDYLAESGELSDAEVARFENSEWDVTEESLSDEQIPNDIDDSDVDD